MNEGKNKRKIMKIKVKIFKNIYEKIKKKTTPKIYGICLNKIIETVGLSVERKHAFSNSSNTCTAGFISSKSSLTHAVVCANIICASRV